MRVMNPWCVLTIGILLGVICGILVTATHSYPGHLHSCPQFRLTNQDLECKDTDDSASRLEMLHNAVGEAIALYLKDGRATRIAVYERDLITHQWEGTNETDTFSPASLMKLPLMMAYFKLAELQPTLLDTLITYEPMSALNDRSQHFMSGTPLTPGSQYTVRYLIEKMIVDSDNNATATLYTHIDPDFFEVVLIDLGIKIPANTNTIDFVSPKSYANLFRALYNASYITREDSETALELLSRSTFTRGLLAGIPQGIVAAHKFGEREVVDTSGPRLELHDCGIVYKHSDPYSICIMTEGKNWDDLTAVIHDLSALIYEKI